MRQKAIDRKRPEFSGRSKRLRTFVALLFAMLAASATPGLTPAEVAVMATPTPAPAPDATPAVKERRKGRLVVVARVGEETLSLRRLRRLIEPRLRAELERRKIDPRKDERTYLELKRAIEEQAVGEWLCSTALAREARSMGLTVSPEEMDEALRELDRATGKGEEGAVLEAARDAGMSEGDFREMLEKALLGDKYALHVIREKAPEESLREVYEKNPSRFVLSPRRRHILYLVTMRQNGVDQEDQLARMKRARRKARRGADFGDLAEYVGMDPKVSYDRWVTLAEIFPSEYLGRAVWKAEVGEVSDVIQTPIGFHLFKVLEEESAKGTTFEECRTVVEEKIVEECRIDVALAALRRLRPMTEVYKTRLTPTGEEAERSRDEGILNALARERIERRRGDAKKIELDF